MTNDLSPTNTPGRFAPSLVRAGLASLCTLVLLLFAAGSAQAQDTGLSETDKDIDVPVEQRQSLDAAALASDLVAYGRENDDPGALVTAARILVQYNAQPSSATQDTDDEVSADAGGEPMDVPFTAEGLLEAARDMEGSDGLAAMIADVEAMMEESNRGSVYGSRTESGRVEANDADRWTLVPFQGGEYARLVLRGDGDTDLDCYLYDSSGNLVDRDLRYTDECDLEWVPPRTQRYSLRISNLGDVWNAYRFAHN